MWPEYRKKFISARGKLTDSYHKISHSEGQGTAMLFAVSADDRPVFDKVWTWTRANLQREDHLFAWRWDANSSPPVTDRNNASDGDILIAWALLEAYEAWGESSYLQEARKILQAVRGKLVVEFAGYTMLLPGSMYFGDGEQLVFNPSYSILPAFSVFAAYENAALWRQLYDDSLELLKVVEHSSLPVPADWMTLEHPGNVSVSGKQKPVSGYDAIRVPLYLAWCGHTEALKPFKSFWEKGGGWRSAPSWVNLQTGERADYAPEPGVLAVRSLAYGKADRVLYRRQPVSDYYSTSLLMFSLLAQENHGCSLSPHS
jgi:endoglucanase